MTKNESLEKITKGLDELKEFAKKFKFSSLYQSNETCVTTDDGTVLKTNGALEVGAEVYSQDKDYNQIVAADGDYKYNGTIITVSQGKIEKIEEASKDESEVVESPEESADVNVEVKASEEEVVEEKVEDKVEEEVKEELEAPVEDRIKSLEEAVSKIMGLLEELLNKNQEMATEKQELESKVQELSAQPGDESATEKLKKSVEVMTDEQKRVERLKKMSDYVKSSAR